MGAWGVGAFENDDAMDWMSESADLGPLGVTASIEAALWPVPGTGLHADPIEQDAVVLAACETIATGLGHPGRSVTEALRAQLHPFLDGLTEEKGLADLALRGLDFVQRDGSDLSNRWGQDPQTAAEWASELADLRSRLTVARAADSAEWLPPEPGFVCDAAVSENAAPRSGAGTAHLDEQLSARLKELEARVEALEARLQ